MLKSLFRKWGLKLKDVDLSNLQINAWKEKGLKSPKLSKYLLSKGISEKEVSDGIMFIKKYISMNNVEGLAELTNSRKDIFNQGISDIENGVKYFFSCQTPDNTHWLGDEDIIPAVNNDLVLWVVRGQEGFKFRAKVRCCYDYEGDLVGFYVDRPYGDISLTNFKELAGLLKDFYNLGDEKIYYIFKAPIWKREDGMGANFQEQYGGLYKEKLMIPSASFGYQDTLYTEAGSLYFDFFVVEEYINKDISEEEIIYTRRIKKEGVYMFNALDFEFEAERMSVKFNMKNLYKDVFVSQFNNCMAVSFKEFFRQVKGILNISDNDVDSIKLLKNIYSNILDIVAKSERNIRFGISKYLQLKVLNSEEHYSALVDTNIIMDLGEGLSYNYTFSLELEGSDYLSSSRILIIYTKTPVARKSKAESYCCMNYAISKDLEPINFKMDIPYVYEDNELVVYSVIAKDKDSGEYLVLESVEEALELFDSGEVEVLYCPASYIWESDNEVYSGGDSEGDYLEEGWNEEVEI